MIPRYRVWIVAEKRMADVGEIAFYADDNTKGGEVFPPNETRSYYFPEEAVIIQSTGLKDKNGKEIFEGDVVKTVIGSIGDIQFSHGVFGIEWSTDKISKNMVGSWGQKHNLRTMDDGFNESIEVIGNIYENPDLLSK